MNHPALLLLMEESINAILKMDEQALLSLATFHGKVICFELTGLPFNLFFIPNQNGELQIFSEIEGKADCTLTGSPIDLFTAQDKETSTKLIFKDRIKISGNTDLAHRFSQTLSNLDIDWEEQLSKLTGDTIAHQLGNKIRSALRYKQKQSKLWQQNMSEYIVEEKHLAPSHFEADAFSKSVEQTRDDVERLEARINRLISQLNTHDSF